ncbi:hypothetical protein OAP46_00220 [bacterium]|nr:hypothetical protein [bacterium]
MGFLKKITRPISRVLDKIVPNELKPALPFLAAAAPFMAPGLMGAFGGSMLSRGLISGGLNLGSQLAQEGSDGDFSGLSTLMAAATGALSTPGSAGGRTIGDTGKSYSQYMGGDSLASTGTQSAGDFFKNKAAGMDSGLTKSGLGALEKSSNYLTGVGDTLQNNLFSKEGLKAALIPAGQGMTDLAVAENRRALKDYEREQADYEAGVNEDTGNRALAIRQSMEAYGFTEQEILDAIEAAGYRAGGRVGFNNGGGADFGGIPAAIENIQEDAEEMITIMTDNGPIQIEKSVYESMPGMFMDTTTSAYGDAGRGRPVPQFANGGRIGLKNGSDGSSTGSFGANRYASELVESADSLLNKGDILMTDAEKLIASGEYPSEEELNEIQKRYEALVNKEETETNKFSKNLEDEKIGDALPYFLEKEKQINKRLEDSNTRADKIGLESLDVSGITRSPSFREWYSLWEKGDPKADKHPQAEYFEDLIFNVDRKKYIKTKYPDIKMADGGLMNLGGREMDMRGGGFIPIGKKERADDVPARLSKNEFVMTADAVRAAGGGSVNEGAKRMYETMNKLEARA